MKTKILPGVLIILSLLVAGVDRTFAQGTAFTYQGRLSSGTNAANGSYDLTFSLFNAVSGAAQVGTTVTNSATAVSNGLFTVTLDFGANFPGANRWLEIGVRTNGGNPAFTILSPRQQLTPTPYAVFASNAASATTATGVSANAVTAGGIQDGTITATKLATGQVVKTLNGLTDNVSLTAGANVTLTTNGNSLQVTSSGGATSGWALGGNSGTLPINFLGTIDNQPLELRVNSARALRLEPNTSGAPNFIAGSSVNFVASGVRGGVIGGGGATNYSGVAYTNSVASDFGTVSGGFANSIQTGAGTTTIGGGFLNTIQTGASTATIGGGYVNTVGTNSFNSTIGGGSGNVVQPVAASGTIGGGGNNVIQSNAVLSTIGGGLNNTNLPNASYATIPGGAYNAVGGSYGFAAGHRAKAIHQGAFVWADSLDADFNSVANDEFAIRAAGGVRINDATPGLFFGTTTRQMLNLFQTGYGIGVQDFTVYQRTGGGFAWYLGGTHTNAQNNAGGGSTLMTLDSAGNLTALGGGTFKGTALAAVHGIAGNDVGWGVYGESADGIGVRGVNNGTGNGVVGSSVSGDGVSGSSSGGGHGVTGTSDASGGIGVYGRGNALAGFFQGDVSVTGSLTASSPFTAVEGSSSGNKGVYGTTSFAGPNAAGVWGENSASGGTAVVAHAPGSGSTGIYAFGTQWAGYFDGPITVCSLTIRGGCDVAEPFQMSHEEIPKGSVVVIDDENAGKLKLSDRAYDSRVAGIVSGANGVKPGLSMTQEGVLEGGQNVALSGRVYVLANAANGAIKPGDLLTTSNTPGQAMKMTNHAKGQGAILGKAMTGLKQGQGMVLVLVSLQ